MSSAALSSVAAPPALTAKFDEQTVAMRVESLAVDVVIVGRAARTTMRMTFHNPHKRDLEGEIVVPLPDGAALEGYALDVDGEIVDAALVERQQARVVFESEVRKNVDPGLLEHVAGNQFRTRIWPVPAKGMRTLKVSYVSALFGEDGVARYDLPLRFHLPNRDVSQEQARAFDSWEALFDGARPPRRLLNSLFPQRANGSFRLRVAVVKGPVAPTVAGGGSLGFRDEGAAWVCDVDNAAAIPERVRIGIPYGAQDVVAVERHEDGEHYFRIDAHVEDADPPAAPAPGRVLLVWDASLSREQADKRREFELLRAVSKRWDSFNVDLVLLRDEASPPRTFSVIAGNCAALLETIAQTPYDGGTRLDAIEFEDDYDACLLFSDGLSALGGEIPALGAVPLYAVSSGTPLNGPLLRHLSERCGGAWLDLERIHPLEAAARLDVDPLVLLGVDFDPEAIADVMPAGRRSIEAGLAPVSGRLLAEQAEITLRFGRGDGETIRRTFILSRQGAATTGLVARLWAQARVDELMHCGERCAPQILELGRRFHLVTPRTSLLVLETLEQHLAHEIPPAVTRSRMRKTYDAQMAQRKEDEIRRSTKKLDRVYGWWQDLIRWWETDFDSDPPKLAETADLGHGLAFQLHPAGAAESDDAGVDLYDRPALSDDGAVCFESADETCLDHGPLSCAPTSLATEPDRRAAKRISIKAWDPATPYLEAVKGAAGDAYAAYLAQRAEHARSPSFYLDCASYFFSIGERKLGLRILSNVAELGLENPQLLRIVGYKLQTEGELHRAAEVFEQVRAMRPEEPQSFRDLALVVEQLGDDRRAAELLWHVVTGEWDERFPEIETIALMELNRILARAQRQGQAELVRELGIESRFLKLLTLDLRIVLAWDADLTDVDLWVVEPSQEKCYYGHNLTRMGGRLSRDFTQGYGPEVYTLRRGAPGTYRIQANYYGSAQQALTGPATILATIHTHYGLSTERRQDLTLRLTEVKDVVEIGAVTLGADPTAAHPPPMH